MDEPMTAEEGRVRELEEVLAAALQWLDSYPPDDPSGDFDDWWYSDEMESLKRTLDVG